MRRYLFFYRGFWHAGWVHLYGEIGHLLDRFKELFEGNQSIFFSVGAVRTIFFGARRVVVLKIS